MTVRLSGCSLSLAVCLFVCLSLSLSACVYLFLSLRVSVSLSVCVSFSVRILSVVAVTWTSVYICASLSLYISLLLLQRFSLLPLCLPFLLSSPSSNPTPVCQIYVTMDEHDPLAVRTGKITFVDLAGSENLKQSGSAGVHQKETAHINRSLFCLGACLCIYISLFPCLNAGLLSVCVSMGDFQ